ncbi:MAG: transporter substrate-binding domain-containing protein [Pseudomonadota bacterium]
MKRSIMWIMALLLCSGALATDLKVAFNTDKPPFAFVDAAGNVAGIEVDVIRNVLTRLGFGMKIEPVSKSRLLLVVRTGQVDIAASVQGKDEGSVYYSDGIADYLNYAITRKEDGIQLATEADLDLHRFVIWQNGWADLGPAFEAKYRPDAHGRFRANYFQSGTQDAQSRVFWARRVEVIVVDKSIFEWYRHQLAASMKVDDELVFHDIFKTGTTFAAAFGERAMRDRFNVALKAMRADGTYQAILNKYK